MAENESGAEKSLEPTEKRITEARERGEVARSRELGSAAVTIVTSAALLFAGGNLAQALAGLVRDGFRVERGQIDDPAALVNAFGHASLTALAATGPILAASVAAAIVAPLVVGGWIFSPQALLPDFSRLNPLSGFGRIFGTRGLVELGKALLKIIVVGSLALLVTRQMMGHMLSLGTLPVEIGIGRAAGILGRSFLYMSCGLLLIAAVDAPYQWWSYRERLRMTREEVREEMKESDGRPEVKAKIRQLRQRYAKQRMMQKVPTADVVVTNPTHFAVALKYEAGKPGAPRVVAKGRDLVAAEIRRIALESGVPLFEAPALARAIYGTTEIDHEIPRGLYVAVAQVLSYVFQIKTLTPHRAARLRRPNPVVGEEFAKYAADAGDEARPT
jgi:flagellar biosynthesis protein FlhB